MKAEIRLPTDTYAYINFQVEGTPEEIIEEHNRIIKLYKNEDNAGLSKEQFDAWLDTYLQTNKGDADLYTQMNKEQIGIIQAIKRSVKRIEYKNK